MRAGSLSDPRVVALLNEHFVCVHVPLLCTKELIARPEDLAILEAWEEEQKRTTSDGSGHRGASFYGGEREVFATPSGELLDVFLSLHVGSEDRQQYSSVEREAPHTAVEQFFRRAGNALRNVRGSLPPDWQALQDGDHPAVFAAGLRSPPVPPGDGLTVRVWVRNDMLMYDGLVGEERVSWTAEEIESWLPHAEHAEVPREWPQESFLRLAHAMVPRGQVLVKLDDASVEGRLTCNSSFERDGIVRVLLLGEVALRPTRPDELGPRVNARKSFEARATLRGDLAWDRQARRLISFRLVATESSLEYGHPTSDSIAKDWRERYGAQSWGVGAELLPVASDAEGGANR